MTNDDARADAYTAAWPHTSDGVVVIQYGVIRADSGWLPLLILRGKERWQWRRHGYDRDLALAMALEDAQHEAARYAGDWDVRVSQCEDMTARER